MDYVDRDSAPHHTGSATRFEPTVGVWALRMRRVLLAVSAVALVSVFFAGDAPVASAVEPQQVGCTATIKRTVTVRKGPSTRYKATASAKANAKVVVYGRDLSGRWLLVDIVNGNNVAEGWVPRANVVTPKRCP